MTGDTFAGDSLESQADELLREDSKSVDLVAQLELEHLEDCDQYADWHASTRGKR